MLGLLAQYEESGIAGLVEKLARTPIDQVVLFALVCTLVRVGIWRHLHGQEAHVRQMKSSRVLGFFQEVCDALIYAGILVFLLIRPYVIQTFRIPSESMVPTLLVSDLLIVNKAIYRFQEPKSGDIVVFKPPELAKEPGQGDIDFVKRLVGAPGEVIEIKNRQLFRNGVPANEPYLNRELPVQFQAVDFKLVRYNGEIIPIVRSAEGRSYGKSIYDQAVPNQDKLRVWDLDAQPVPDAHFLMIGDNRDGSFDGRFWGLIPRDAIVGKAWLRFWPPNRIGMADSGK
ncbi:MAG: signal peptidase I [Armatimonadota bacterium]|nr:signal peptidase I [Armatimonadota bacterium]